MRKIIISESQLALLEKLVKEEDGVLLNNGSVKEFGDSNQIGTSATITNSDGDPAPVAAAQNLYIDRNGPGNQRHRTPSTYLPS